MSNDVRCIYPVLMSNC